MSSNPKLESALRLAAELENRRHWGSAEAAYNDAISAADPSDRFLVGTLHINLGHVARKEGRVDQAIACYQRAGDILEGSKGEALMQRGYALWQKATLLLQKDHPEALTSAAESLKLHRAYPYTTTSDLADAVALDFVVRLFFGCVMAESEFATAWREVKAAPCASLALPIVFNFLSNYLLFIRQAYPDDYLAACIEVERWALPDLFAEIVALVEGGPKSYHAVTLRHRLQQALMGIRYQGGQ